MSKNSDTSEKRLRQLGQSQLEKTEGNQESPHDTFLGQGLKLMKERPELFKDATHFDLRAADTRTPSPFKRGNATPRTTLRNYEKWKKRMDSFQQKKMDRYNRKLGLDDIALINQMQVRRRTSSKGKSGSQKSRSSKINRHVLVRQSSVGGKRSRKYRTRKNRK